MTAPHYRRKKVMITITSKKDGFRRCVKAHSARPVEYPDSAFSKKDLAILQAEPMLVVAVTEDKAKGETENKAQKKAEVAPGK